MACKPKVIVDTDPGIDDAAAIFMLLEAHRKNLIELLGITTVNGNTTLENANINVYRILEVAQMTQIPVYSGASKGLVNTFVFPNTSFHGNDGFSDIIKDDPPQSLSLLKNDPACLALVRLVDANPGEIILIAIGPLTNLAIAINISSEWTAKLRDLYIMGGNILGQGNITLAGEFNFTCDPEAAKVVLDRSKLPIKLTPWETCVHACKISLEERKQITASESECAKFINMVEEPSIVKRTHWITCDQLSVAWFLHDYAPTVIREELTSQDLVTESDFFYATVELSGEHSRGLMVIDHRNRLNLKPNILCMRNVNRQVYLKYLKLAFL